MTESEQLVRWEGMRVALFFGESRHPIDLDALHRRVTGRPADSLERKSKEGVEASTADVDVGRLQFVLLPLRIDVVLSPKLVIDPSSPSPPVLAAENWRPALEFLRGTVNSVRTEIGSIARMGLVVDTVIFEGDAESALEALQVNAALEFQIPKDTVAFSQKIVRRLPSNHVESAEINRGNAWSIVQMRMTRIEAGASLATFDRFVTKHQVDINTAALKSLPLNILSGPDGSNLVDEIFAIAAKEASIEASSDT